MIVRGVQRVCANTREGCAEVCVNNREGARLCAGVRATNGEGVCRDACKGVCKGVCEQLCASDLDNSARACIR